MNLLFFGFGGRISLFFMFVLFLLPTNSFAKESIKIGMAGPLSGDLAPYGIPVRNTLQAAIDQVNQSGGVLGRRIKLVSVDDMCKPEMATNVASKLVGEGVVAVIGHVCSGATIAAMAVYRDAQIPVLSPSATNPSLTLSKKNSLFFRTIPHDAAQADLQAEFIQKHLKAERVAVIHDKGDYGKGLARLVMENLKKRGIKITLFEGVTPGAIDYSALVRKIKRSRSDVVAFGGYHPEGSKIVTQARKRRIKAKFISGDGLKDPSFIKIGGKYVEGYYVSSPSDISKIPSTIKINKELESRKQKSGNFGLQAHAALSVVLEAIKKSNSIKPAIFSKILRSNVVATTLGEIHFDQNGDIVGSGFSIYQIQKGQFVNVNW